ncbi:MAG: tyrosine--tRNA ligase [Pseudomonadota bacterium]|nr:tyrosine--tRNA ligase [Pseudomonadota bacterium]
MTTFKSDFLHALHERGFIHQGTDLEGLDKRLLEGPVTGYIGFDATATSLHAGHMIPIMMLRWLQKTGGKPVVLIGGGTTRIGDPTGKDEMRKFLTDEQIAENIRCIRDVYAKVLTFGDGPTDAMMVNNANWLDELRYVPFLRDVGRHFTINRMLTFDSVKSRLEREQPLTFLEFNYMILQGYDFVELNRRYKCVLQMGGSDQWGNIISGVELMRRITSIEAFGLTTPLLLTAAGLKMGKSVAGAVWLNADQLSPYGYWQYWRNVDDADVGRFLRLFTGLPMDEIARLEKLKDVEINEAKKILAREATTLCHGRAAAEEAAETARRTFEEGASAEGLPTVDVPRAKLEKGVHLYELLRLTGLAPSNGEAKRLIKGGGARVNDAVVEDEAALIRTDALSADGTLKLSAGKKRHALVKAA